MRKKALELALAMCCLFLFKTQLVANPANLSNTSNFELVDGLVIVEAELEGNRAYFILDTGSPMMVLNEKCSTKTEFKADNMQGAMSGNLRQIKEFAWAGLRKTGITAFTTDMSALEKFTHRPLSGLIGYDFLEGASLVMNYEEKTISIQPFDSDVHPYGWVLKSEIPFVMAGHLPIIEAKIGEQTLRFGLDTGSTANLLDLTESTGLTELSSLKISAGVMSGMEGVMTKTSVAIVPETEIDGLVFRDMRFLLTDILHLPNLKDNEVDGLLGFPFFKEGKFTLNYSKRTISIWE